MVEDAEWRGDGAGMGRPKFWASRCPEIRVDNPLGSGSYRTQPILFLPTTVLYNKYFYSCACAALEPALLFVATRLGELLLQPSLSQ